MKRIKIQKFIISISTLVFGALFIISSYVKYIDCIKYISLASAIANIVVWLYIKYFWKFKIFNFSRRPKIIGKYNCIIEYEYKGVSGKKECIAEIKQDLLEVNVRLQTDETTSYTLFGDIKEYDSQKQLIYVYRTDPNFEVKERNPNQFGTARLTINDDCNKLTGEYWTNRKTCGKLTLIKLNELVK